MPIFGLDNSLEWVRWATAGAIMVVFIILALLSRFVMSGIMRLVAHRTKTQLDDMIVHALGGPFFAFLVIT